MPFLLRGSAQVTDGGDVVCPSLHIHGDAVIPFFVKLVTPLLQMSYRYLVNQDVRTPPICRCEVRGPAGSYETGRQLWLLFNYSTLGCPHFQYQVL